MLNLRFTLLAVFLVGCSSTSKPIIVKTYNSPSVNKVALVKPVAFIRIEAIDDDHSYDIFPSGGFTNEYEIEFTSGKHSLQVSYFNGANKSFGSVELSIDVEKGRKYIIRSITNHSDGIWRPALVDVTNKPECWTLDVGTRFGPKNCE
ncbi:hypothetical protein [uncultured Psychrosphaera sp.]|uniref:hypothetical protein n=1 Tax=uncultured Psychrosphaera sp. TaxID=1403522 RepID=UPI00262BB2EB|nr:hypothetical protein [uncultured Psychrosphaera sp.]